ncbi:MAG TPA: hypothetical protein VIX59_14855 [Candidatus Binataceae bacterium]|jgi:hypothetical protein
MKSTFGIWSVRTLAALSLLTTAGCFSGPPNDGSYYNSNYHSGERSNWNHSDEQGDGWKANRDSSHDHDGGIESRNAEYSADYSDRYYRDIN